MTFSRIHKQPAAAAPSNSPSNRGVQASGTSPDSPIGTASPTTTAIACRGRAMRRPIQAASNTAAAMNHCSVLANVWSCRPNTSSPRPPSCRNEIACGPERVQRHTQREPTPVGQPAASRSRLPGGTWIAHYLAAESVPPAGLDFG